ncbi:MAG: DUF4422 domain-containing protein [Fusobacteriaceae bacterium]|nr:DUF4422 domain-containing protein [Fusobacteriaceae bacterium]
MNLKIFIATHKKFDVPKSKYHVPLHVGREGKEDLGYLGDNTGDNISLKNPNYCELTGLYWIWKNVIDIEYVGICHYRRYFGIPTILSSIVYYLSLFFKKIEGKFRLKKVWKERVKKISGVNKLNKEINLLENYFENNLKSYDLILTKEFKMNQTTKKLWENALVPEEIDVLRVVILEKYPKYIEEFDKFLSKKKLSPCNMFISRKSFYDNYCEWLFDILFEVEKRIKISEDIYKARVFGFMGEYLLNVYINYHKEYSVKRVNMLFVK